jgi:hypothetical protein
MFLIRPVKQFHDVLQTRVLLGLAATTKTALKIITVKEKINLDPSLAICSN